MTHVRVALIGLAILAGLSFAVGGPMLAWVNGDGKPPTAGELRASTLSRALHWLWDQQAADGLLRADRHAQLRRGEAVTAAALLATSRCPPHFVERHQTEILRALEGLANESKRDAVIDYPCYSTACHLHALTRLRPPGWQGRVNSLLARLRTLQLAPQNGWQRSHPAFGGFGLGDSAPRAAEAASLVTLSTTVTALAAARAAGVNEDDPLVQHARVFIERCQNQTAAGGDGGFFGAPTEEWRGGKGGTDPDGRKRSYGTATADGVRGLQLGGSDPQRIEQAWRWLAIRDQPEVPGLLPEFEPALRLYWAAALSAAGRPAPWVVDLGWVLEQQREDGAFIGFASAMKEDEPVVATILAIRALTTQ